MGILPNSELSYLSVDFFRNHMHSYVLLFESEIQCTMFCLSLFHFLHLSEVWPPLFSFSTQDCNLAKKELASSPSFHWTPLQSTSLLFFQSHSLHANTISLTLCWADAFRLDIGGQSKTAAVNHHSTFIAGLAPLILRGLLNKIMFYLG